MISPELFGSLLTHIGNLQEIVYMLLCEIGGPMIHIFRHLSIFQNWFHHDKDNLTLVTVGKYHCRLVYREYFINDL
jgi:hypothetical protein